MREMKNSGVAWIGEIPIQWSSVKIKYYCDNIFAGGTPQSTQEEYWDGPIKWIPSGSCHNKKIYVAPKSITQKGFENSSTKLIPANTALVAMTGATCGNTGYLTFASCANQSVTAYVENKRICNSIYLWYAVQAAKEHLLTFQTGGAQGGVNVENCKNIYLPYVSLEEQNNIAEYLECKTQIVEEAIANQEAQIEKLKQYKQSLITEVVTKGLNPNAEMKDSGIEWIGTVNSRFNIQPINALFSIEKRILGKEPEQVLSITQRGIVPKDITSNEGQMANSYAHYQIVHKGDFAMNHMDLLTGGVGISEYEGVTSPDYRVFAMKNKEMNARYFLYVFETYYKNKIFYAFGQGAANVGRWRLPAQNFKTIYIPVPSVTEQNKIVIYLDEQCAKIDKLIEIKQSKIAKLNEYKKSLIYEYVTGKKDVQ